MAKLTKQEQQQYDKCLAQCTQCLIRADCKLRIKIREIQSVKLIAASYRWICRDCNWFNVTHEWGATVKCFNCGQEFQAKHIIGE